MHFKEFLSLILEEKELKQLCLKNNTFLLQLFLVLKIPKQIYAFREKKVKKKKDFQPTYPNFIQAVTWTTHIFSFGLTV